MAKKKSTSKKSKTSKTLSTEASVQTPSPEAAPVQALSVGAAPGPELPIAEEGKISGIPKMTFWIVIAVVAVLVIGLIVYFATKKKADSSAAGSAGSGQNVNPITTSVPVATTSVPVATTRVPITTPGVGNPTTTAGPTSTFAPTTTPALQRPTVIDQGYADMTRGWYNAEGLGCYNYCRYVGPSNTYPQQWFSCMLVDRNGSTTSPVVYTDPGVYDEIDLESKKCS